MAGREKSKQARSKVSSERMKKDRISELPYPLLCLILSHLPTKEVIKTSALSTRWRSLWLWVPSLELNSQNFPDRNVFTSFGNRLFDSDRMSCVQKLKLTLDEGDNNVDGHMLQSCLTSWIDAATKRKLQHLNVWCLPDNHRREIPISLYTCETLVTLRLFEVVLPDAGSVSLPSLKTMHLKYVWYPNDATFERLVSCCPVLEELKVSGYGPDVILVRSLSLKRLRIKLRECNGDISLTFGEEFDEASVSSKRDTIRKFLPGISKVGDMIIDEDTFKVFSHYSKLEPLLQFDYMTRLDATLCLSDLKWLPTFLERCPNLKSLVLALDNDYERIGSEEMNEISFSTVPECLLSSLESVDIKSSITGNAAEMKLLRYFLRKSLILKKLTLRLKYYGNGAAIFKKLLRIPRRSITCQVVVR
ncbi:unnamed protein product [Microthlaspi erraticum]|uniref:F-box domain-containing protein n=1 Tax=Microthlaspi erraticum TaxID=1685480 RepID=A0A6D2IVW8_9BRAS|nr:unnamed protein product [Microthlaspi erraticum]